VSASGIFLMNADGSNLRRVTEASGEEEPSSSPSGEQFVYLDDAAGDGTGDLYLIWADGSGKRRLTTGSVSRNPDWRWPSS
jgi:Tol biopolymer transport system component